VRRKTLHIMAVLLGLSFSDLLSAQDQQPFRVLLDVSHATEVSSYALDTLVMEWYPKINDILFDSTHPLPFNQVRIVFEPGLKVPAYTVGNEIHVSSDYIKTIPDDFKGMIIHELTHVNQHYPVMRSENVWLMEGIADYIRHKYFEKDIQVTLNMNATGQLYGYTSKQPYLFSLEGQHTDLDQGGYRKAYTVASTFLYWLESRKNKQIVPELNLALSQSNYSDGKFRQLCGQSLDDLWAAFVAESKASSGGGPPGGTNEGLVGKPDSLRKNVTVLTTSDGLSLRLFGGDANASSNITLGRQYSTFGDAQLAVAPQDGRFINNARAGDFIVKTPDGGSLLFGSGLGPFAALVVDPSNNVGIKTASPAAALDVHGEVKLSSTQMPCGPATAGTIRFRDGKFYGCDGTRWRVLAYGDETHH
jgi:hypothetical protein